MSYALREERRKLAGGVTGSLVTSNSHHRPVPEAGCPVGPREPHRSLRNFDEFRLRIWFDNIDDEFREIPII